MAPETGGLSAFTDQFDEFPHGDDDDDLHGFSEYRPSYDHIRLKINFVVHEDLSIQLFPKCASVVLTAPYLRAFPHVNQLLSALWPQYHPGNPSRLFFGAPFAQDLTLPMRRES
jgi:hypothetical protein